MKGIAVLGVAAVVAITSTVGLVRYVGGAEQRATASADLVPVLTAASDIPDGTSFSQALAVGAIVQGRTLRASRPATAVVNTKALDGMVADGVLHRGEIIVTGQFVSPDAKPSPGPPTFATSLPAGSVAVSFQAPSAQAVSDLVTPGDYVNLLVLVPNAAELGLPDSGGPAIVHVFQHLLILAIGSTTAPLPGATKPAANPGTGSYTVAVAPIDAARLVLLTQQYQVFLTLDGPGTAPAQQGTIDKLNALPPTLTPDTTAPAKP